MRSLGEYTETRIHACIGGTSVKQDIEGLKRSPHIVVATPGKLTFLLKKNLLSLQYLSLLILDEADEMLSRGFSAAISQIFTYIPGDLQVSIIHLLCSLLIFLLSLCFM